MKISGTWHYRPLAVKMMLGLVFTTMVCAMDVAPALGRDDHRQVQNRDVGRYDHRGRGYNDGRYDHRGRGYDRGRYTHRPYGYGYRGRVYAPPPVIYAPPPSPGIGIFFPPLFFPTIIIRP